MNALSVTLNEKIKCSQTLLFLFHVLKVACTNWKRVLMVLNRQWSSYYPLEIPAGLAHDSNVLKHLSNFTLPEIYKMIKLYKKLIVVRHPLERLLSAYRNKFEAKKPSAKYFQARFGRKIIRVSQHFYYNFFFF